MTLHPVESIKKAIDPSFKGVIDFAVCDSILLQQKIASNDIRVITNGGKLEIKAIAIIQKHLIRALSQRSGADYAELLYQLIETLKARHR